jgi:uncharacterized membrane protein required for colicin V production
MANISTIIDAFIIVYLAYCTFVGLRRGFFNVLVSIFGTYGACFLAWFFQDKAYSFLNTYLGFSGTIHSSLFFLGLWFLFYTLTYLLAKFLTVFFKLTGVNFILRIIGAVLNLIKGVLIVVVVLTFISGLNVNVFDETALTSRLTSIGSNALNIFRKSVDENQIEIKKSPKIDKETYIMDDDFRYNLLER